MILPYLQEYFHDLRLHSYSPATLRISDAFLLNLGWHIFLLCEEKNKVISYISLNMECFAGSQSKAILMTILVTAHYTDASSPYASH